MVGVGWRGVGGLRQGGTLDEWTDRRADGWMDEWMDGGEDVGESGEKIGAAKLRNGVMTQGCD